jgi:hypothetical protein
LGSIDFPHFGHVSGGLIFLPVTGQNRVPLGCF